MKLYTPTNKGNVSTASLKKQTHGALRRIYVLKNITTLTYQNYQKKEYNCKANYSNVVCIKKPKEVKQVKEPNKYKTIAGLPFELLAVFLLSKKENEGEIIYNIDGKMQSKSLQNIEKSRDKLAELLIAIELNQNIVTQKLTFLNSDEVLVTGQLLKKGSIECLVKAYDAYKNFAVCNKQNNIKMSLRQLIAFINNDKSKSGRQNLMTMLNLILLSKVYLHTVSKDSATPSFPKKLFKIETDEFNEKEAMRQIIRHARLKKAEKVEESVGLRTGKLMSICNNLYINFNESAFEELLNKHTKLDKYGKVKHIGSHFQFPVGAIKPAAARLFAFLDCYKSYVAKSETFCKISFAKTFSLECVLGICGQEREFVKNPKRFEEVCKLGASHFGAISFSKFNFSIVYGSFLSKCADVQNGEDLTADQYNLGNGSEQNGGGLKSCSNNVSASHSLVNKKVNKKVNTSSDLLDQEKHAINIAQKKIALQKDKDKVYELNFSDLSLDVYSFVYTFSPYLRAKELARLRELGSIDKYENEIKFLSSFEKFRKNLLGTRKSA